MTCTWCFQKIAPSTLEKSCKGEHRQQEGEEGEWEFPRGAKGVCVGLCLPLGSSEPPPLTLHTHPLRLTPGLAHFGGWGGPCSLCICGHGGSPQPWPWRLSSVPGGGLPGGGSLPPWAAHDPWVQQSLEGTYFQNWDFSPSKLFILVLQGLHRSSFRSPVSSSPASMGPHRAPCSEGPSPTPPSPFPCGGYAVLHCALFLIAGTGIRKFWEPRHTNRSLL